MRSIYSSIVVSTVVAVALAGCSDQSSDERQANDANERSANLENGAQALKVSAFRDAINFIDSYSDPREVSLIPPPPPPAPPSIEDVELRRIKALMQVWEIKKFASTYGEQADSSKAEKVQTIEGWISDGLVSAEVLDPLGWTDALDCEVVYMRSVTEKLPPKELAMYSRRSYAIGVQVAVGLVNGRIALVTHEEFGKLYASDYAEELCLPERTDPSLSIESTPDNERVETPSDIELALRAMITSLSCDSGDKEDAQPFLARWSIESVRSQVDRLTLGEIREIRMAVPGEVEFQEEQFILRSRSGEISGKYCVFGDEFILMIPSSADFDSKMFPNAFLAERKVPWIWTIQRMPNGESFRITHRTIYSADSPYAYSNLTGRYNSIDIVATMRQ